SYKVGDSARTGIEVVHQLITLKVCKLSRYFIKLVSLLRISLIKGLRSNLKFKSFHLLEDIISSLIHIYFLVKDGVVPFLVDDIEQRGDGSKLLSHKIHKLLNLPLFRIGKHHNNHNFTR